MIKTIFFDLDDTLLDFQKAEAEALCRALHFFGIQLTPYILERYHVLNGEQWRLLEEGILTRDQVLIRRYELLFQELNVEQDPRQVCDLYEQFLEKGHWLIPGAIELLEELVSQYNLYVASNGASKVQRSRLRCTGIERYFKGIFISEEMPADKPSPAFFQACFAAIPDFDPAAALIVGDSLTSDIRGGKQSGIHTCWFNPLGRESQQDIIPDYRICSLYELPLLLKTL